MADERQIMIHDDEAPMAHVFQRAEEERARGQVQPCRYEQLQLMRADDDGLGCIRPVMTESSARGFGFDGQ